MGTSMKLVILDRDGTINSDSEDFVKSPEEWTPLPGALEAIARLNHGGWHVVIASNQSGLGRGLFEVAALNAMHAKMYKMLAAVGGRVDAVFYCPHTSEEACVCRKPLPGLFEQISLRFGVSLKSVASCGDSLRDVLAAAAAGCEPHLVLTGKSARYLGGGQPAGLPAGTLLHRDLGAFADYLLERRPLATAPAAPP
jgi:D-glycero-D-manno-heptose 1,7-bisphosphate phosphatase